MSSASQRDQRVSGRHDPSSLTVAFDGGRSVTVPIDNARLNAGASEKLNDATFKDTTGTPVSSRLTVTMGYRADGGPSGSATASASVQTLTLVTLSGVVTNLPTLFLPARKSRSVRLPVRMLESRATTDAGGRYALSPLVAGAFSIRATANGYTGRSFPIDIATDAPFNIVLQPDAAARGIHHHRHGQDLLGDVSKFLGRHESVQGDHSVELQPERLVG